MESYINVIWYAQIIVLMFSKYTNFTNQNAFAPYWIQELCDIKVRLLWKRALLSTDKQLWYFMIYNHVFYITQTKHDEYSKQEFS